jgi:hypothetical protein
MFRGFLLTGLLCVMFTGCDVRKKDKKAVMPLQKEITDPTTVQVIDSVYDFGKISEGEVVEYSYRFKNIGDKPLLITEQPHASCGCTVAERPEEPIMPGDTGFIKVKFNSENRPGEAHKTVTVSSNANPPFPELLLKGEVTGKQ